LIDELFDPSNVEEHLVLVGASRGCHHQAAQSILRRREKGILPARSTSGIAERHVQLEWHARGLGFESP
jgi:hypothetical protein